MSLPLFFSRQAEDFAGKIPFIVTDCIDQLKKLNADQTQGIFRLSGSARDTALLCSLLDSGRVQNWGPFTDPHSITGALKKYFRDRVADSPFFPFSIYDELTKVSQITDEAQQVQIIKKVFSTFSQPRFLTAVYLFRYLFETSKASSVNLMTPDNIAIVFAPNLLGLKNLTPDEKMAQNPIQNKTVSAIIRLVDVCFADVQITEENFLTDEDLEIIGPPALTEADLNRIKEIRQIRKRSLIPCVPDKYASNFNRPTRVYEVPAEISAQLSTNSFDLIKLVPIDSNSELVPEE